MKAHRVAVVIWLAAAVAIGAGSSSAVSSPQAGTGILTNERIFASAEFAGERFGPARWLADGSGYTTVEASATLRGGDDIVRYDPATGARGILVAAQRFVPPGASRPLAIDNYTWSDDGSKLLLYSNSQRVWRQNTRGDYWVLDLQSGTMRQLGGDAAPATLRRARRNPGRRHRRARRLPHEAARLRPQQAIPAALPRIRRARRADGQR